MGRPLRAAQGGLAYHVLNRGNARLQIFDNEADYAAFERVLGEVRERVDMRICCYCLMPNHWHLVVWPRADGDLSTFMRLLTVTHTQRWHAHRHTAGSGHVYQGRFKSFPVQGDGHFLAVCRYVERNALRANLVRRAEAWRWGSLCAWTQGEEASSVPLSGWPVPRPADWLRRVNRAQSQRELDALRTCIARNRPFGSELWQRRTARALGLESTLHPRGRPRNKQDKNGS